MKPRITVITIGVDNLERAVSFYRDGLGLKTEGIIGKEFEYGAVAFFELQAGLKLAVWPRKSIAHDSGLLLEEKSATEFTLGQNVSSRAEVDAVMKQARNAGAVVVKPAQDTFWGGYAGYDRWFAQDLTNAHLGSVATYHALVPGFRRMISAEGGDLKRFFDAARALSRRDKTERDQILLAPVADEPSR